MIINELLMLQISWMSWDLQVKAEWWKDLDKYCLLPYHHILHTFKTPLHENIYVLNIK